MANTPPVESAERHDEHEESRFNIRAYVWFVIAFVLVGAVLQVIVWVFLGALVQRAPSAAVSPLARDAPGPPEPRLQGSQVHPNTPAQDLREMRQREEQVLTGYGWTDREAGLARIPIARAMDLLIERGMAATQPAGPETAATRPLTTAPIESESR